MKRYIVLGIALALVGGSAVVDAQVGGLLRKKAGEVLGKKPEPATPAPAPVPAPAPGTAAPAAPATPAATPATPATTGSRETAAAPKAAVSPLDPSALPVRESANQVLRERIHARSNGDWDQLPYIPAAATAAAYGLSDSARATFVETVGMSIKTLVMSAAYLTEHDAFIKNEHQGVNHGLKGVVTVEEAARKGDFKQMEALQARMMVAMTVDQVKVMPPDMLKADFTENLPKWKQHAANPKNSERAKYQKMVAKAQSIEALPASDEKFLRGYAVIKSIDADGPDTEDAVYAMHARFKQEQEQAAYDAHSLKGQLKQQLTNFVAIASKVNFNAPTVEKNKRTMFVNPADERQGAIWKACFRAGEASTAAAVKVARAWLSEL
jgi:hypothetical protein